jgi:hypothetical protein
MSRTLKIAIISALMLGTASAAMAQPHSRSNANPDYNSCQTDEGQGRTSPCDTGNGGA